LASILVLIGILVYTAYARFVKTQTVEWQHVILGACVIMMLCAFWLWQKHA
jgi:hypothetical protein